MRINRRELMVTVLTLLVLAGAVFGQTTAFNYQGRLTEGGNPANGEFRMQFKLFDSLGGAGQVGSTLSDIPVTVTQGTFTAKLDFGANSLSGANRWLEIAVRHSSSEFYTTLSPREQIVASPYAVRTISAQLADNASALGGIPANQYVTNATVGSAFVRNGTTAQSANFNISGNGIVGGNVGIGINNPTAKLEINGTGFGAQQRITDSGSGNSLVLQSGSGTGLKVTGFNYNTNAAVPLHLGVDGAHTSLNSGGGSVGIGTTSPTAKLTIIGDGLNGYSLGVSGNVGVGGDVTQTRDKGGMVKALVLVHQDGVIFRCYNGLTGVSLTGGTTNTGCGFTVTHFTTGGYGVNFGFQVSDRYAAVTAQGAGGVPRLANWNIGIPSTTTINVWTFDANASQVANTPFYLVVF